MAFEKITNPNEYDPGSKTLGINNRFAVLREALGEPFYNRPGEPYPDDDYKTDVCWGFRVPGTNQMVCIWNYKNGPAYNSGDNLTLDSINHFSVYVRGESLWEEIQGLINAAAQRLNPSL